jgi:hypothetical protein
MTPAEAQLERENLYHHSKPFVERIENCIQRYRAKRKLDEFRNHVFSKYLSLGGINSCVKQYTSGIGRDDALDYDKDDHRLANARDWITTESGKDLEDFKSKFFNPSAPKDWWTVDFKAIAAAFLSTTAPYHFGIEPERVDTYCTVVHNFLNYVLMHSVCPEYTADIIQAQKICQAAKLQLCGIRLLASELPGKFNRALSLISGGYHAKTWMPKKYSGVNFMSHAQAWATFLAGFRIIGNDDQIEAIDEVYRSAGGAPVSFRLVKTEKIFLEVVKRVFPTPEVRDAFYSIKVPKDIEEEDGAQPLTQTPVELTRVEAATIVDCDGYDDYVVLMEPLGTLRCVEWTSPLKDDDCIDMTPREAAARAARPPPAKRTFSLWMNQDVMALCFEGLKFEANLHTIVLGKNASGEDVHFTYLDHSGLLHPSFYTVVENESMEKWKKPTFNERPAPNVDDAFVRDVGIGGVGRPSGLSELDREHARLDKFFDAPSDEVKVAA